MKKMNKKGLTLIELIVSLGLLSIILIFLINFFLTLRTTFNKANSIEKFDMIKDKLITYINSDANNYGLLSVTKKDSNTMEFKFLADENKSEFTKQLKYNSSNKSIIYSCSTCLNSVKLSNTNGSLPSNFTFTSFNVEEINNIFKVTFVGQIDGKQKNITIYPRKTFYNEGSGSPGEANAYPSIEDVLNIDESIPGPFPPIPGVFPPIIEKAAPPDGSCTNTLAYDGTIDNNLRYVGKNPCNYIKYNDELWRIVGVMNNIDDGSGHKKSLLKIVRKDSIGKFAWDASGVNDWTKSDLMPELNGDYSNTNLSANTNWYVNGDTDGNPTGVFNYNRRLKNWSSGIESVKWNLGTGNDSRGDTASISYTAERSLKTWGTESGQTCNDGACPRAKSWSGKIGLLYPSDYGFAVGGDVREECLQNGMFYQSEMSDDCHNNNWIGVKLGQWYITPSGTTPDYCGYSTSFLYMKTCKTNADVFPAAYLYESTYISSGTGTESDPYILDYVVD